MTLQLPLKLTYPLPKPFSLAPCPPWAHVARMKNAATPATVYLVGAAEARRAVEALAERLECPIEVHILKRKAPLTMEPSAVRKLKGLRKGDAVIATFKKLAA